jgi:hypothetical protein
MHLLLFILLAQQPDPCAPFAKVESTYDLCVLETKRKELALAQDNIDQKAKARHASEVNGLDCQTLDTTTAGTKITCTFNGDDSAVLGGPVESYTWTIEGLKNFVAVVKTMTVLIPNEGVYTIRLTEQADHGHKQQSHKMRFAKVSPIQWDQEKQPK